MVVGLSPAAVAQVADNIPVSGKTFLDIQAVREGRFTLNAYATWSKHTITVWDSNNTRILSFLLKPACENLRVKVWEENISKNIFLRWKFKSNDVPYTKKNIFNWINDAFLSIVLKILTYFLFLNVDWKKVKSHSLRTKHFQKFITVRFQNT